MAAHRLPCGAKRSPCSRRRATPPPAAASSFCACRWPTAHSGPAGPNSSPLQSRLRTPPAARSSARAAPPAGRGVPSPAAARLSVHGHPTHQNQQLTLPAAALGRQRPGSGGRETVDNGRQRWRATAAAVSPNPTQQNSLPIESVDHVASASAPIGCHSASSASSDSDIPAACRIASPTESGQSSL